MLSPNKRTSHSPASDGAGLSSARRPIVPDAIEIILHAIGVVALVSIVIAAVAYVGAEIEDRRRWPCSRKHTQQREHRR
jgi:hypothetical protein